MDALTLLVLAEQQPARCIMYEEGSTRVIECAKCAQVYIDHERPDERKRITALSRPLDREHYIDMGEPQHGDLCACGVKLEFE